METSPGSVTADVNEIGLVASGVIDVGRGASVETPTLSLQNCPAKPGNIDQYFFAENNATAYTFFPCLHKSESTLLFSFKLLKCYRIPT